MKLTVYHLPKKIIPKHGVGAELERSYPGPRASVGGYSHCVHIRFRGHSISALMIYITDKNHESGKSLNDDEESI